MPSTQAVALHFRKQQSENVHLRVYPEEFFFSFFFFFDFVLLVWFVAFVTLVLLHFFDAGLGAACFLASISRSVSWSDSELASLPFALSSKSSPPVEGKRSASSSSADMMSWIFLCGRTKSRPQGMRIRLSWCDKAEEKMWREKWVAARNITQKKSSGLKRALKTQRIWV